MTERVNASPTKEFFISMLTRDISLTSSIIDLVDNSVDAATASGSYEGKYIRLIFSDEQFEMLDNCGGISLASARGYAFKFGRPNDAPHTQHSVGRFGVGMKRALFKMGKKFIVTSHHQNDSFQVSVDVDDWLTRPDDWNFDMELIEAEPSGSYGTQISVQNLHELVSENFSDQMFIASLKNYLEKAHFHTINKGFKIYINNVEARLQDIKVRLSDELSISQATVNLEGVSVSIKAGIGERSIHEGGWNIVCNGRLIEYANKSSLTGWGIDGIRSYHPDFAFFRGVIEFDSEDGGLLPWNTTKTGIDVDNPVYRSALPEIKNVMRPILLALTDRVREQESFEAGNLDAKPINEAIEYAELQSIFAIDIQGPFIRPQVIIPRRQVTRATISYQVPIADLEAVKAALGVTTNRETGLLTFNHFRDNEL